MNRFEKAASDALKARKKRNTKPDGRKRSGIIAPVTVMGIKAICKGAVMGYRLPKRTIMTVAGITIMAGCEASHIASDIRDGIKEEMDWKDEHEGEDDKD